MDISAIPRSFWHSVSFCMVIATIGLLTIAYKSAAVSIEIADAKINLSSALSTVKDIKSDLEVQNEKLIAANKELQDKLEAAKKEIGALPSSATQIDIKEILDSNPFGAPNSQVRQIDPKIFQNLDKQIKSVDSAVKF